MVCAILAAKISLYTNAPFWATPPSFPKNLLVKGGVRVVCLRSAGSPDAPGLDAFFHRLANRIGVSREALEADLAQSTMLKRMPRIAEVANMAALMASDYAGAMTGAIANVTCGDAVD